MIRIEALNVVLPGFRLKSIDLSIASGEFFVLLGPTGAGKTLILESIAGIVPPASGRIRVNDQDLTPLPPEQRPIGIVYQDHALFPHLSVYQNITYGIRYLPPEKRRPESDLNALVAHLSLGRLLQRSVVHLSGGEKQRVALARALAVNPDVLLLDEPLASLDPNFRQEIRDLLKSLHRQTGITVLMVTHNFVDAHYFAGRVGVIHHGALEQVGSLAEVFYRPRTPFVAGFVGMENVFEARFEGPTARVGGLTLHLTATPPREHRHVAIRPEDIRISAAGKSPAVPSENLFQGTVHGINNRGFQCSVDLLAGRLRFRCTITARRLLRSGIREGDAVPFFFAPASIHTL